jgi:hypothetical protein
LSLSLNLEVGQRHLSVPNKSSFRWLLNGQTIDDLTSLMEFDRNGRGVFLPHVCNRLCLVPDNYQQGMISETLDSMISAGSSSPSTPICTTDTESMSSVFSVSYYIYIILNQHFPKIK